MFGFLFKRKKELKKPNEKVFQYLTLAKNREYKESLENKWFREDHWQSKNFLVIHTSWSKDWRILVDRVPVAGTSYGTRADDFLMMGDLEGFQIYLERDPNNEFDSNAIKVMGKINNHHDYEHKLLGFLPQDISEYLAEEKELDVRLESMFLPTDNMSFGFRVRVLGRSLRYLKRTKQVEEN